MKKILLYLVPFIVLALASCKEEPPAINYEPIATITDTTFMMGSDTIPDAQKKAILIEDISGVKCVNCPDAALIARTLAEDNKIPGTNESRVNVVTVQPMIEGLKSLTEPIDHNGVKTKSDLRTGAGADICELVALPGSLPNGYVNRKKMAGKSDAILAKEEWGTAVQNELLDSTPVNIEMHAEYNRATAEMTVTVELAYTRAAINSNYLSVAIVEDSIVDAQEKKDGGTIIYDQNYLHRHILRDMFTSHTGDLLNTSAGITLLRGRYFKKVYKKQVTAITVPEHFMVAAYVHEDATSKYVLHSKEVHVVIK
jgi:hypothetical protein